MSDPLLHSVRAFLERTAILPPDSTVVVAVSGGQDSCTLLHLLDSLRKEMDLTLHCAHFNHGFRREADDEAVFVRDLAGSLGVPFHLEMRDVPGRAHRSHLSSQEAARKARHNFLERIATQVGADFIALGHTQDDRVETVLMNILRGTGPDGLQGLAPASGMRIRPLLEVSRQETADYCRRHHIDFCEDASNQNLSYTRNRLRLDLLSHLTATYNPNITQTLLRLSELVGEENRYMEAQAQTAYECALTNTDADCVVLSNNSLRALPMALRRRVVRMAVRNARGDLNNIDFQTIERVTNALDEARETQDRFQFDLQAGNNYGMTIRMTAETMSIYRRAPELSNCPIHVPLPVPGEQIISPWGLVVITSLSTQEDEKAQSNSVLCATLDADAVRLPMVVRSRQPGDRIQPLGMMGSRKVQDILVDRKVPAHTRDKVPIIADSEGILWVAGHTISERAKLRPGTQNTLSLKISSIQEILHEYKA